MMRDEGLTTEPGLSAADDAVSYLLQRCQVDVDLRWLMLDTEAFHRLCVAEAERTSEPVEIVKDHYRELAPHCRRDIPRIKQLQAQIDEMHRSSNLATDVIDDLRQDVWDEVRTTLRQALDLCETCRGLPDLSINRCPMCRQLQEVL